MNVPNMPDSVYLCPSCGFWDIPPAGTHCIDKCPYCRGDDWVEYALWDPEGNE